MLQISPTGERTPGYKYLLASTTELKDLSDPPSTSFADSLQPLCSLNKPHNHLQLVNLLQPPREDAFNRSAMQLVQ